MTTAIRDDTVQVEAEERVLRVNAELERRVGERTVELTASNEALRQFAWAASHDLQEPIRMVLSYSQWLGRCAAGKLDTSEMEMLGFIEESGVRMETLLAALRQYIYISESGETTWERVETEDLVRTAVANLEGSIDETGATIDYAGLPAIHSVKVLLVQIFQNLIGNALKYRSPDTPRVRIFAERGKKGWVFSVADNGVGIDPQYHRNIFRVFTRLHGRQYPGTGIGLAICKAAVDRLGGQIWVDSSPGAGSIFSFELPEGRR